MDRELVEWLTEVAEDYGVEVHPAYSGRFMYGNTCFGLSGDFADLWTLIMEYEGEIGGIPAPTRDSLGFGEIWYWPGVEGVDND